MGDLQNPRWLYLKGALFLFCGILSSVLLVAESPDARTVLLLSLSIWSFCRCYYFAFYVIEHYVDGKYRFVGLWDFAKYCLRRSGDSP